MIKRIKDLNIDYKDSAILVKLSKSGQSAKVDLPTIGINTIKECINSKIKGIAIESQKTLIVNKKEVVDYANQNNIFIYAI